MANFILYMESAFLHTTSELKGIALLFMLPVPYISTSKLSKRQQYAYLFNCVSHKNYIYILIIIHLLTSNQ